MCRTNKVMATKNHNKLLTSLYRKANFYRIAFTAAVIFDPMAVVGDNDNEAKPNNITKVSAS